MDNVYNLEENNENALYACGQVCGLSINDVDNKEKIHKYAFRCLISMYEWYT